MEISAAKIIRRQRAGAIPTTGTAAEYRPIGGLFKLSAASEIVRRDFRTGARCVVPVERLLFYEPPFNRNARAPCARVTEHGA